MFVASASLTRAPSASERATPPPANISGVRDAPITLAASSRASRLGTMREIRAGLRSWTSSRSTPASGGISIRTGRGAARAHLPERFEHRIRYVPRSGRLSLPLGYRSHGSGLVHDLMDGPEILANRAARDLSCDEKNRRRTRERIGQAGRRIVKARPRHDEGYPRPSRRTRVTVRHERRSLLVPGRDHADARLVPQRGDDSVDLYPRYPEHDLDALVHERLHKRFATGHCHHQDATRFSPGRGFGNPAIPTDTSLGELVASLLEHIVSSYRVGKERLDHTGPASTGREPRGSPEILCQAPGRGMYA